MGHEAGGFREFSDFSVFVGDLAPEVDDVTLEQTFRTYYPSTKQAKVMLDPQTGRTRGFGFVRFTVEAERDRAMHEMNGVFIGAKPIRVSLATRKSPGAGTSGNTAYSTAAAPATTGAGGGQQHAADPAGAGSIGGMSSSAVSTATRENGSAAGGQGQPGGPLPSSTPAPGNPASSNQAPTGSSGQQADASTNPNNTTLFIGGLSSTVSEAELHALFSQAGEIVYTKIPQGKGCGFVQFVTRPAAEYALETLNGYMLGGMPIRVSWGKSSRPPGTVGAHQPSTIPPSAMHASGGPYGGPPGTGMPYAGGYAYDPYTGAYAAMPYDPYTGYPVSAAGGGSYAMDPYGAYGGYAVHAVPNSNMAAVAAAQAAAATHGGPTPGNPGALQPVMYDPLSGPGVDKMNMAYMHRTVPMLTGTYMRYPVPTMPMGTHMAWAGLGTGAQPSGVRDRS